eukprot:Nitzschia sp. Nitz4//scaffold55_size114948//61460//62993//NITZ4_003903-RA/size114948-snap-gene-0.188-mRNA-1//-1//CDS//3329554536//4760//frame0
MSSSKESDITVYGATSFVAKHILKYLFQVVHQSDANDEAASIRVTIAGRNESKLQTVKNELDSLPGFSCIKDVYVADGSDLPKLQQMAQRTKVVINCAGPYSKYSSMVVAACAEMGTDYVDFTGEVYWVAAMRQKYGALSKASGARIVSMCGYDSIPSDLALFAAVQALRQKVSTGGGDDSPVYHPKIYQAKVWHQMFGMANGGTVQTAVDYEWDPVRDFSIQTPAGKRELRSVPFLVGDPLSLTHPTKVRHNPDYQPQRDFLAASEWWNQIISLDQEFGYGVSLPMPMAAINLKVMQASSVALDYGGGQPMSIRERMLPLGFTATRAFGAFVFFPMLILQIIILCGVAMFRFPYVGKKVVDVVAPPGSGAPDWAVEMGNNAVYAVVTAEPQEDSAQKDLVNRGYAYMNFHGDAGNAVTAQCVVESALALLLNKATLPPRSEDGFGTPAEILGKVLLERFIATKVRPIEVKITARTGVTRRDPKLYIY